MDTCLATGIVILVILFIFFLVLKFVRFPLSSGSTEFGELSIKTLVGKQKKNIYDLSAVIIEPRTKNLVQTLRTFLKTLPPSTHFVVYHGLDNRECLIKNFESEIQNNKISLHDLGVHNLTIQSYNYLMTSPLFYESIPSENILVFQTDSTLCSNSKFKISDFTEYDYVGAPMGKLVNSLIHLQFLSKGKYSPFNNFMNGGLSFRKKSKMIEILKNHPWDGESTEDTWICFHGYCMGAKLPTKEESRKFSFETEKLIDGRSPTASALTSISLLAPFGLHKPRKNIKELIVVCPEVKQIETVVAHTDYRSLFLL